MYCIYHTIIGGAPLQAIKIIGYERFPVLESVQKLHEASAKRTLDIDFFYTIGTGLIQGHPPYQSAWASDLSGRSLWMKDSRAKHGGAQFGPINEKWCPRHKRWARRSAESWIIIQKSTSRHSTLYFFIQNFQYSIFWGRFFILQLLRSFCLFLDIFQRYRTH